MRHARPVGSETYLKKSVICALIATVASVLIGLISPGTPLPARYSLSALIGVLPYAIFLTVHVLRDRN